MNRLLTTKVFWAGLSPPRMPRGTRKTGRRSRFRWAAYSPAFRKTAWWQSNMKLLYIWLRRPSEDQGGILATLLYLITLKRNHQFLAWYSCERPTWMIN